MEAERRQKTEDAARSKKQAADEKDWEANVHGPLGEVMSGTPKNVKVPQTEDEKTAADYKPPRTVPDYSGSVSDYLGKIRSVLNYIRRKSPDAVNTGRAALGERNIFGEAHAKGAKSTWLNAEGIKTNLPLEEAQKNPEQALESLRILAEVISEHADR
jgi:hypothetical protein